MLNLTACLVALRLCDTSHEVSIALEHMPPGGHLAQIPRTDGRFETSTRTCRLGGPAGTGWTLSEREGSWLQKLGITKGFFLLSFQVTFSSSRRKLCERLRPEMLFTMHCRAC